MILALFAACGSAPPFTGFCDAELLPIAEDEVTPVGLSPAEVAGALGAEVVVDAEWSGRHSQTPPSDRFTVTIGALVEALHTSTIANPPLVRDDCPDELNVTVAVDVASADGAVTGAGTLSARLIEGQFDPAAPLEAALVGVSALEIALSDARWAEAEVYVDPSLPPPTSASLYFTRWPEQFDAAEIYVSGDGYGLSVWKCDEQLRDPDCVDWTFGGAR